MQTARITIPGWLAGHQVAGASVAEVWAVRLRKIGWTAGDAGPPLDGRCFAASQGAIQRALDGGAGGSDGGTLDVTPVVGPADLPAAERALIRAIVDEWIAEGVRIVDPDRVWIEPSVAVAAGAVLWGGCVLRGRTAIGAGAVVHPGAVLDDTEVGDRATIKPYSVCESARIGPECAVGPMAHLRPGAVLERDVKVGNFVEVKAAVLREGVRASHLSYLGDAEVGAGANVGAGTITCNYDGFAKHRTEIGAGAFIGSNTSLVAPLQIGSGAIIGAGSTVTRTVPDEALMVERADERVLEGRAPRVRQRNKARAERK